LQICNLTSYGKYFSIFYARQQNASRVLAIWPGRLYVCPSVCHTAVLYQNGASPDHQIFSVGCLKDISLS